MNEPVRSIDDYLRELKRELSGSDPALIQDALYDTEEHFRSVQAEAAEGAEGELSPEEVLAQVAERFGSPSEVAEAYRSTEEKVAAALAPPRRPSTGSLAEKVFGVLVDSKAYLAMFYMLLSLATGIIYFTWVVTGLSMSIGFSILIIGLPFFLLFLATVRAISLGEGRIVEALLGERMPRRPVSEAPEGSWLDRVKYWLTDSRTWLTMLYMVLQLPLGVLYFTVMTVLLSFSFSLFAAPIVQFFFGYPVLTFFGEHYFVPFWMTPVFWLAAGVDLLVALHVARAVGRLHGALAKSMLSRS